MSGSSEPAPLDYVTADVFTDIAFGGNPLAVVLDARGLTAAAMQAIAAEFNYSESTFLLPPDDPAHTARVRIFTPRQELPFAGHPNIGTAFVVAGIGALFGRPVGEVLQFEEAAGLVAVAVQRVGDRVVGARLTAPQPLTTGQACPPEAVAACVDLSPADIVTVHHPPRVASVGLPFLFAELASLEALARSRPVLDGFARHLPRDGADAIHLYVRDAARGPGAVRARVFAPLDNIWEDPATGSANAALVALLADLMPERDCDLRLSVLQGVEMGRPSLLDAEAVKRDGRVGGVHIGGRCVHVMAGRLALDGAMP